MIILGGLNQHHKKLDTVACLNIDSLKWKILVHDGFPPIAYHASCPVFRNDSKMEHVYKLNLF